jgi:hypothetical protein
MQRMTARATRPLPSLLQIVEGALTAMHLAEADLRFVPPDWRAERAGQWLDEMRFDVAPVAEQPPHRYVHRDDLVAAEVSGSVLEVARPIDATILVTANLGLADTVALLGMQPFCFVLDRKALVGIVTRADLQRQAVGMVTLSMILAAEAGINQIIERCLGEDWLDLLGNESGKVEDVYQERVRRNAEISRVECLMLHHRLKLLKKCPGTVQELGFVSMRQFDTWAKRLRQLRDTLAHGGSLLDGEPDPQAAVAIFEQVRTFAEAVWTAAQRDTGTTPGAEPAATDQA